MNIHELNEIIEREHKYPVQVSELVYPEVEELYLSNDRFDKSQIGAFYQKYDYAGVRNALEILNHLEEFKKELFENLLNTGRVTEVAPSQYAILEMIGWNVEKLNLACTSCWMASVGGLATDKLAADAA